MSKPPLRPDMTVRQIAADYPGTREVFLECGEADRPGIKFGHLEPLEHFARRNHFDCNRLLQQLAGASNVATAPASSDSRNVHRPFIVMALVSTLSIGAGWGGWLLWQIGSAESFDAAATGSVVAHGEAQLWGFIAPFIIGIALRYLPVATSRSALSACVARTVFAFLVVGVAGGFFWSLLSWRFAWLGPVSGASLVAAALLYLTIACRYVGKKLDSAWARFIVSSACWLCVWAMYTLWLRASASANGPGSLSEAARLRLLESAVFGFALNSIFGFGLRLLPGFLGLGSPTRMPVEIAFWLHNLGVAALVACQAPWIRAPGAAALATGGLFYVVGMRGFRGRARQPSGVDPASAVRPEIGERFLRRYMQLAFCWLLISLAMLAMSGMRSAWSSEPASRHFVGAARHALTVGFMTTLILGVAQRLLPVLGQTLLAWPKLVRPIFACIALGNLWRVTSELAAAYWPAAYRFMPISALFELTALTLFAANCFRTLWPAADALLRSGIVTPRSSLRTLLAAHPPIEDELVRWGFGYIARVRAVPGELTIGSFALGEGHDPVQTVERINTWLSEHP